MSTEAENSAATGDEQQITFTIKASNDQKFVLTLASNTTVGDLKIKLSGSEYADIPTERIRLIYSGRVLKDADTLAGAKLKDGHTVHMVKGAASNARQNPASSASSTAAPQNPAANVPTNIAAGTGNNPLAAMTGARYAGFHGLPNASMFGADGGMGPPPGTDDMLRMMDDPNFLQQMNEMMDNPAFQQMMENSPMLQNNPMARSMLRDPNMRRMMFSPQMLRMQLEMQRSMGGGGLGGAGGSSFPAPGVTDTTPQTQGGQQQSGDSTTTSSGPTGSTDAAATAGTPASNPQANPFGSLFGNAAGGNPFASPASGGNQANPFAALFGPPPTSPSPAGGPAPTGAGQQQNPLAQLMAAMGGVPPPQQPNPNAGGNPGDFLSQMMGAMGGAQGQAPAPAAADNRPPEERYADQLRQLNDMGFFEFEKNVQALRQSGGSVQGAVEYLLTHP